MLRYGIAAPEIKLQHRIGHRWQKSPSTNLLNDFDYVIQALFAEQANTSLDAYKKQKNKEFKADDMKITKFDLLDQIWSRLLPHRQLHISGDDIRVSSYDDCTRYNASEMSDGERAIFYLVGQALVAQEHALLVIDEPELHVHPSIMSKLWDEIEAARPDCAFIFITHDLNFAAARSAQKYVIKSYNPKPLWEIQETPNETGFDEETTTLILGSRRPILFAEGERSSLDFAIYRSCFPDWTVIPRGSCGNVIYSVATMRENAELTWVKCSGIVDADDFRGEELERLRALGVEILPVSEIENIFLLPDVCRAIAQEEGFCEDALEKN